MKAEVKQTLSRRAPDYSSGLTLTGSTISVVGLIAQTKSMLMSAASSDPKQVAFIEPLIKQLQIAEEIAAKQGASLASTQKHSFEMFGKKIEEYEVLVNANADEPVFQEFFEKNPAFLDFKVKVTMPKKSFGGENIPDFLLALHDSTYVVVEIEKPGTPLFTERGDIAAELTHAQQQIRDYIAWAIEEKEYLRKRGCPDINADNTRGLVVIGKNANLNEETRRKLANLNAETRSRYEIKTFDGVLHENKVMLDRMNKL